MTDQDDFPAAFGRLNTLPRARLFSGHTQIEAMPNLADAVGSDAKLFVKRDDCTQLAFGGNKVRQLEFYLGEAVEKQADTILITSAVQSNFVRLAAAGAAKLGMKCHIQLEDRVKKNDPDYHSSGNVLLNNILGATMHRFPDGEDEAGADQQLNILAEELRSEGKQPYIIPLSPGHSPLGALGYVVAADELLVQAKEMNIEIDEIVVASGSGNTHAGLLFGLRALGADIPVTGVCVRRDVARQEPRIRDRCGEIGEYLGVASQVRDEDVVLLDDFLQPGYGQLNDKAMGAILLAARTEGLMLDPTYTSKAMAGFLHRAESAKENQNLLFIHTGGIPALFGYRQPLLDAMAALE